MTEESPENENKEITDDKEGVAKLLFLKIVETMLGNQTKIINIIEELTSKVDKILEQQSYENPKT